MRKLLEFDGGAGLFELGLGGLGGCLVGLFEDRLRCAVDEVLGLLEAQAGEFADGAAIGNAEWRTMT